jgi:hypothetical protein
MSPSLGSITSNTDKKKKKEYFKLYIYKFKKEKREEEKEEREEGKKKRKAVRDKREEVYRTTKPRVGFSVPAFGYLTLLRSLGSLRAVGC